MEDAAEYFGDTDGYPPDIAHHGVVLEKQGKPDEAKSWYREAADLGHPAARKVLDGNPDTVKE
ncbi:hypothetical protein [Streptomyces sp. NPDC001652]|uniref:hypothetical protein n=1 Tax=Streptomyces sp. NPDC001652 TaxID=3154393 RepID=UPI00331E3184